MTDSIQKDISSCSLLLKILSSLELHDCFSNYISKFIECCILQFPVILIKKIIPIAYISKKNVRI